MTREQKMERMRNGQGFIAALDQSGGSTPKALRNYGISDDGWSSDQEMFALIHRMRVRIITSSVFTGEKVLAAILFEKTMDGIADGKLVPAVLIDRGVVPFIKIDKGLEEESHGVQLMKPIPGLTALLARAKGLGVFGTKERSVINAANRDGIAAAIAQQFEVGRQVLAAGMMPILEPEFSIEAADRQAGEEILKSEILRNLDALSESEAVMLKLSLPVVPNAFEALIRHPNVLRVVALSGGYSRHEACAELANNHGMIASFSRALLQDLRTDMSDDEFDRALGEAIGEIYQASIT